MTPPGMLRDGLGESRGGRRPRPLRGMVPGHHSGGVRRIPAVVAAEVVLLPRLCQHPCYLQGLESAHMSSPRSIPLAELGTAQQPAWLAQPAAPADLKWELDRLAGQPPPAAAENKRGKREKERGKDPAAPSWGHAPGTEGKPAGLAAELGAGRPGQGA